MIINIVLILLDIEESVNGIFLEFISEELDNLKCYDNLNYKIYGGEH